MNRLFDKPNKYIVKESICYIECYCRKGNITGYGIIDIWNIEKCKSHKWCIANGYLWNSEVKNLHNFILGIKGIDHKNRNRLDNREDNLRVATKLQNNNNVGLYRNNTSGYKGVHWNDCIGKWCSQIRINNKNKHLGYFKSKEEAALAWNAKALELHGEFAYQNTIRPVLIRRKNGTSFGL